MEDDTLWDIAKYEKSNNIYFQKGDFYEGWDLWFYWKLFFRFFYSFCYKLESTFYIVVQTYAETD